MNSYTSGEAERSSSNKYLQSPHTLIVSKSFRPIVCVTAQFHFPKFAPEEKGNESIRYLFYVIKNKRSRVSLSMNDTFSTSSAGHHSSCNSINPARRIGGPMGSGRRCLSFYSVCQVALSRFCMQMLFTFLHCLEPKLISFSNGMRNIIWIIIEFSCSFAESCDYLGVIFGFLSFPRDPQIPLYL